MVAVLAAAAHLTVRLGETTSTALARELSLAQRVSALHEINDGGVEQIAPPIPPNPERRPAQLFGGSQPLLDRHREEQGRLLVGPSPQCGTDRGDRRRGAGQPGADHQVGTVAPSSPHVDPLGRPRASRGGHRDSNSVLTETLQTPSNEGRRAIQVGGRATLKDRSPKPRFLRERTRGGCDDEGVNAPPPPRGELRPKLRSGDTERAQLLEAEEARLTLTHVGHSLESNAAKDAPICGRRLGARERDHGHGSHRP